MARPAHGGPCQAALPECNCQCLLHEILEFPEALTFLTDLLLSFLPVTSSEGSQAAPKSSRLVVVMPGLLAFDAKGKALSKVEVCQVGAIPG